MSFNTGTLNLSVSTTVMTSGTSFTVDVRSPPGAKFFLSDILLIGTTTGEPAALQTITLNSSATATTESVPSTVVINPATLESGWIYELQVDYFTIALGGVLDLHIATLTGLLVTTAAAAAGGAGKFLSTPSGSVIGSTPTTFPPTFSSMPTSTLTSISTSPSPTTATTPGGAVIATGAGGIIASGSPSNSSGSSGSSALSTGAKAGIAVGVVALVLVIVIAALFAWRAGRKRQSGAGALELVPNAEMMPYTHNRDTDRDLTAEKEMNIIGAPGYAPGFHHVDTGFSDASSTAAAAVASGGAFGHAHASPTELPPAAAGLGGNVGPVPQQQYMQPNAEPQYVQPSVEPLPDSPYVSPVHEQPPIHSQHSSALLSAGQFGSQLASLHEPGMSDEELARLADEERRLDEAIAEAERRRGSDA